MRKKLEMLYGREAATIETEIRNLIKRYQARVGTKQCRHLSEKDSILITYADSMIEGEEKTLKTLKKFLDNTVGDTVSGVHVLPFYPYSSDDGFSVIDYLAVKKEFGDWSDVDGLGEGYDLMFDAVINHISQQSDWYEGFKAGEDAYKNFFIVCDPAADYSKVVRPRALPLLTQVDVEGVKKFVWTTFSEDQIDLNFANPKVMLKILEVLFEYVRHGAKLIRLDAIGFAWKEFGTTCIHLPQTHTLIQLMREALMELKEGVVIITETNVPHEENVSYFGDGHNEAHMVYQFPLPPLTLYSLLTGDGSKLSEWASSLAPLGGEVTYFNFLASHDGIGLRPVEKSLTREEVQILLAAVERNGGRINYKNNSDGSKSPYEMNINYMDALKMEGDSVELHCRRFIAAQAILYSMIGVPGVYIHSLLGSGNDIEGMKTSGVNRRINREKLSYKEIDRALLEDQRRQTIFEANVHMLKVRSKEEAFNPFGSQEVLSYHNNVLSLRRCSVDGNAQVLVLINLTSENISLKQKISGIELLEGLSIKDELVTLTPYEVFWVKEK